ncbi:MAG: AraC family transcriptional regulator [Pedobacter sp.]|nr:AraC family transcriptional regulator [Pedobacter sp.]
MKQITAVSISQLCHQLLLVESKRALYTGVLSVKEIAYQLGFSDQSYFSRFFRKHSGITPEQFRKQFSAIPEGS